MRKLCIFMSAVLFLGACEQENLVDADGNSDIFKEKPQATIDKTKITGLWESNGIFDGAMSQKVRIRFAQKQEKVTLGSECKYTDGTTLYAQVEAPAVFKNNGAEITAADQDYTAKQNGNIKYDCFASVVPVFLKIGLNGKINLEDFTLVKIAD